MLLADGRTLYLNDAHKAVQYFDRIGFSCPDNSNPADFFMFMMSIEAYEIDAEDKEEFIRRRTEVEDNYKKKIDMLTAQYENSELRCDPDEVHPEVKPLQKNDENNYRPGLCKQYCLLLQRGFRNVFRIPLTSYFRILTTIAISLMIVLIYGQLGTDSQSIQSRNGVLFFIIIT
jgi:hypothetical protein